ncbi:MAG TPA: glucose-1-phosphate adenylyltransferase [Armatimonadota bacterium]|nr:glucose-1-phosphate adenylyltransferase [Armatimonadota bacterium]
MKVFTIILAGGEGSRLSILAEKRAKPAMPFAGKYRIIDFTLSNCANSGLSDIAVLTQYRPHSLNEHIGTGRPWDLDRNRGGARIWQPYRGRSDQDWYRGTADALYQNRSFIAAEGSDTLLVLSGDHIYKQDYREMLNRHASTGADLTIAVMNVPRDEAHRFGIMSTDRSGRITEFHEKPKEFVGTLASMGIYVFRTDFLLRKLKEDARDPESEHDFGRNIIPSMIARANVYAYPFSGYWVDVGTIPAYWQTNLELLEDDPALDLYDARWTIHTRSEERPPVKILESANVSRSLLSNGCLVSGTVVNSLLCPGVVVEPGAEVRDSIIFNDAVVASGARVDRCILDKRVMVGRDAIVGYGTDTTANRLEPDNLQCGITIAGKEARIPPGVRIGRNCRIDSRAPAEAYAGNEIPSGECVLGRQREAVASH